MPARTRTTGADLDRDANVRAVLDALRRTVRALRAAATMAEDVLGITGAQHFALQKLMGAPGISLNDLANRTLTHKSSLSVVVSRLVEQGLVHRERAEADGRGVVLSLTPAGRRALRRVPDSAQTRLVRALGRLPQDDLAEFARLFDRFTRELGVRDLEPAMLFEDAAPARGLGRRSAKRSGRSTGRKDESK
jgi:DNA-binding MarR family transcriptional regulator